MIDKILNKIRSRLDTDSRPQKLKSLVEEILKESHPEIKAFELAETLTPKIIERLLEIQIETERLCSDIWYSFNSSSVDYIQGPCFIEPNDSPEIAAAKRNRVHTQPLQAILEELHFSEFEILCASVLSLLGAREYTRTKHSRDQGIDFYGQLYLGDLNRVVFPFIRFQDNLKLWLVGQAKHYPQGKVRTPDIRNLVGRSARSEKRGI